MATLPQAPMLGTMNTGAATRQPGQIHAPRGPKANGVAHRIAGEQPATKFFESADFKALMAVATRITTGKHPKLPPIDRVMNTNPKDVIGYLSWDKDGQPSVLFPNDPQVQKLKQVVADNSNALATDGAKPPIFEFQNLPPPPLATETPVPLPIIDVRTVIRGATDSQKAAETERGKHARQIEAAVITQRQSKEREAENRQKFRQQREGLEERLGENRKPETRSETPDLQSIEQKVLPLVINPPPLDRRIKCEENMPQTAKNRDGSGAPGKIAGAPDRQANEHDSSKSSTQTRTSVNASRDRLHNGLVSSEGRAAPVTPGYNSPSAPQSVLGPSSSDRAHGTLDGNRNREVDKLSRPLPPPPDSARSADTSLQGSIRNSMLPPKDSARPEQGQRSGPPLASTTADALQRSYAGRVIHDVDPTSSTGSVKRKRLGDDDHPGKRPNIIPSQDHKHVQHPSGPAFTQGFPAPSVSSHTITTVLAAYPQAVQDLAVQRTRQVTSPGGHVYYRPATPEAMADSPDYGHQDPIESSGYPLTTYRTRSPAQPSVLQPAPISVETLRQPSILDQAALTDLAPISSEQHPDIMEGESDDEITDMVEVEQPPQWVTAVDGQMYQVKVRPKFVPVLRRNTPTAIAKRRIMPVGAQTLPRSVPRQLAAPRLLEWANSSTNRLIPTRTRVIHDDLEDQLSPHYQLSYLARPASRAMTIEDSEVDFPMRRQRPAVTRYVSTSSRTAVEPEFTERIRQPSRLREYEPESEPPLREMPPPAPPRRVSRAEEDETRERGGEDIMYERKTEPRLRARNISAERLPVRGGYEYVPRRAREGERPVQLVGPRVVHRFRGEREDTRADIGTHEVSGFERDRMLRPSSTRREREIRQMELRDIRIRDSAARPRSEYVDGTADYEDEELYGEDQSEDGGQVRYVTVPR